MDEAKQERSVPVQSRVDLVSLARLDKYWLREGYHIKSMSQLLSWSIELVCRVLEANRLMPEGVDSLTDANRHLSQRGLYQNSMIKKGFKKRAAAMSFESLRIEGVDPKVYARDQYNTLHGDRNVEVFEGKVNSGKEELHYGDGLYEEALRKIEEDKERSRKAELDKAMKIMASQGKLATDPSEGNGVRNGMTWDDVPEYKGQSIPKHEEKVAGIRQGASMEELNEYTREQDRIMREKENAPVDVEEMRRQGQVR